ncbi:N-acetylmuramoyl-L-alanine amidase family protein [Aureivirga marina]|uniref:N-acetylmuramoyl-L-alanine amidase family protein n=1 Tax=Aureivirga marina TaxID=1182451 RepID=UPI001E5CB2FC|nr:N-acetylmuramoyl-L-alanine amidase [Aureivirga marina]
MKSQLIIKNYKIAKRLFFCLLVCNILLNGQMLHAQKKQYVIVLDAGHGGKDPGKVAFRKYKEKDVALKITKKVGEILTKNKRIKVIYTRKTDVFVDLWERGSIANKAEADLFVSIHLNAHTSAAHGTETYVLGVNANQKNLEVAKKENSVILLEENYKENYRGFDLNSPESFLGLTLIQEENLDKSLTIASLVQNNFTQKLKRKNRGVKQLGLIVLHQTYMPSILIEAGFLTNKKECDYLISEKGQNDISQSIANAIIQYVEMLEVNSIDEITEIKEEKPVKKIEKKEVKKAKPKAKISKTSLEGVIFKVQIASSKNKIKTYSRNFKGLKDIQRVKVGRIYRYYYGETSDYKKARENLKRAKNKGYSTSYIIAFKNGDKITLEELFENKNK